MHEYFKDYFSMLKCVSEMKWLCDITYDVIYDEFEKPVPFVF